MNKKMIIFAFYLSLLLPGYCLSNAKCFYLQLQNTYPDTIYEGGELGFQGEALGKKEQKQMEQVCEGDIAYQFRTEEILPEVSMEEDVAVLGYGGRMQTFAGNSMVSGRFLNGREFAGDEKKCVVSDKLAVMADLQIRDRIRIHREEFEIIGIMHGYGKNKVVVPYNCFADIYAKSGRKREGRKSIFKKYDLIPCRSGDGCIRFFVIKYLCNFTGYDGAKKRRVCSQTGSGSQKIGSFEGIFKRDHIRYESGHPAVSCVLPGHCTDICIGSGSDIRPVGAPGSNRDRVPVLRLPERPAGEPLYEKFHL